ncbi:MAG: prolipoprotein diacylglyceryl transferase [Candidatus Omnitrophica bacterium]|nr:prolipoprotein diacylglyceryl transferase [Candidatus Omnitrophota bacterium]
MHPIVFTFHGLTIYTYGLCMAAGLLIGLYVALRESPRQGIQSRDVSDIFFWGILSGLVGARLLYVIVEWGYFLRHPARIFFAREGFVFFGGFISAFCVVSLFVKGHRLPFWTVADILAPSIAVAHAVGRLGCFFYGCCYGCPTDRWYGMIFPSESPVIYAGQKVIPTQLIESAALFCIFGILLLRRTRRRFSGELFALYLMLYGISRFLIEFLRGDPRGAVWILSHSHVFPISQVLAFTAALLGLFLFLFLSSKSPGHLS